tara:strand:- start:32 stop:328 length:297 start_codon:yes stop_codon:yes gene_type:complete
MAITKETELFKIDSNATTGSISVRVDFIIKEDGVEISRTPHRHSIIPCSSVKNSDGSWTHTNTDISNEDSKVQDIASTLWTDEVKQNFVDRVEAESIN